MFVDGNSLPEGVFDIPRSTKKHFRFVEYCVTVANIRFDSIVEMLTPETTIVAMSFVRAEVKPVHDHSLKGTSDGALICLRIPGW